MNVSKRSFLKAAAWSTLVFSLQRPLQLDAAEEKNLSGLIEAMEVLGNQIDAVFVQEDLAREVQIGMFSPTDGEPEKAAYGRRIAEQLRSVLIEKGYNIAHRTAIRAFGKFSVDPQGVISISLVLAKGLGQELKEFSVSKLLQTDTRVQSSKEFVLVSAPAMPITPGTTLKQVVEQTKEAKEIEDTHPENAALQIDRDSILLTQAKFRLRLVAVDPNKQPHEASFFRSAILPTKPKDGLPIYRLNDSQCFAIELANERQDFHMAAEVFIDGISTFALDQQPVKRGPRTIPRFTHWGLTRNSRAMIPGWFKNLNAVSPFQVVPDSDSVAFRLGETAGLGKIQVLVFAAWTDEEAESIPAEFKIGTTRGVGASKDVSVALKEIRLNTGALLANLTVHYEHVS